MLAGAVGGRARRGLRRGRGWRRRGRRWSAELGVSRDAVDDLAWRAEPPPFVIGNVGDCFPNSTMSWQEVENKVDKLADTDASTTDSDVRYLAYAARLRTALRAGTRYIAYVRYLLLSLTLTFFTPQN